MNPVRKVKNKINSQEGATLLIGVFFIIMCAVVAVIILAAATTASGSVGTLTSSQQAYYSATYDSLIMNMPEFIYCSW